MAHAQKQDFVFRRYRRVYLNRLGGSIHSTTGGRAVHISLQGLYCSCKPVFCSHVTLTGYPLHSPVSPSLLRPCVTVCHHISNAVYQTPHNTKNDWFTACCLNIFSTNQVAILRFVDLSYYVC